ncbi:MAG: HAMP domain-containing protein [Pseudomonadales bacterium]|nr:HAMP domain-containing protein [Pseudomonadales bacterium]
MIKIPNTVFFRTALMLVASSLLLTMVSLIAIIYFVLYPIANRSADDLAALVVLYAQTWAELPPDARPELARELLENHQLKYSDKSQNLVKINAKPPYIYFLSEALDRRLDSQFILAKNTKTPDWYWIELTIEGHTHVLGFHQSRVDASPFKALTSIIATLLFLAIISALLIALTLTRPLRNLSLALRSVGQEDLAQINETGFEEIGEVARKFNEMSLEVHHLLENRTVLLAGISHDLRTPITRMHLLLEMIPEIRDSELSQDFYANLTDMEHLLRDTMIIARGISRQDPHTSCDLVQIIKEVTLRQDSDGNIFTLNLPNSLDWSLPESSFKRVLTNLTENAIKYGGDEQINISLNSVEDHAEILIRDHGRGIPTEKLNLVFQPFFRLEGSRGPTTGGSGLGLAIVKQICDANAWKVSLETTSGGGGCTARLVI